MTLPEHLRSQYLLPKLRHYRRKLAQHKYKRASNYKGKSNPDRLDYLTERYQRDQDFRQRQLESHRKHRAKVKARQAEKARRLAIAKSERLATEFVQRMQLIPKK